ncbi:MAG: TetR/AcrR family transcriptional regulator [Bacteroidota bacterium]
MEVQSTAKNPKTAEKILRAATAVFVRKGFSGARMEEIARESGMNRALLHYYFDSKEHLFDIIFERHFMELQGGLGEILISKDSVEGKIRAIVHHFYRMIKANPQLPMFIIHELSVNPDRIVGMMRQAMVTPEHHAGTFMKQVEDEGRAGTIRQVDPAHLLVSIIGMVIYPFLARPVLKMILRRDDAGYEQFMESRPDFVIDTILTSLKP